ncbi:TRAF3-interacting protein 1 [Culicoides brevitarsis]|uniref:TRAF3-interacting protein 1 n=1 Tax=Culicoides brevitarsis TaxID=469753 RepID=UPI00307C9C36
MEVDIKIIKETQKSLGKLIKRPQLTDKLLQKPPFRFLHDIIKAIIKDTGFLAGLFTPDELEYEKIKDKESKVAFLTKLINVVKITSGKNLTVRPSKIIAGLEAAKTNELLQAIAFCVDQKIDSKEAIQKVKEELGGGDETKVAPSSKVTKQKETKTQAQTKKEEKPKKPAEKKGKVAPKGKVVAKPVVEQTPEPETNSESKTETEKDSVKEFKKLEEEAAKAEVKLERGKSVNEEEVSERKISPPNEVPAVTKRRKSLTHADAVDSIDLQKEDVPKEEPNVIDEPPAKDPKEPETEPEQPTEPPAQESQPTPNKRTDSGRQSRMSGRRQSVDVVATEQNAKREASAAQKAKFMRTQSEDKMVKLRPQSVRPPSARPGAPKRRDKNIEIILQPEEIVKPQTDIIAKLDTLEAELEDNVDNLVIIEDPTVMDDGIIPASKTDLIDVSGEKEGALVQQILETQREFTNAAGNEQKQSETTWESPFDSRALTSAKTEALRESIQKLTKSVNPLGKLLDFMQEDIDSMQIELTQQLELYRTALVDLEAEKAATEAALQPFRQQVHQLRENIKHYETAIMDVRCNILNNEQKIFKKLNEI